VASHQAVPPRHPAVLQGKRGTDTENNTPVLFHNDFQPQNFIIDEQSGKVAGYIDFDNWQVGVKEQEFVKMQYWGLRELDPAFEKAFLDGYKKHHWIDKDFLARVNVYKAQWFLLVYNFEMDKITKNERNITVDNRFPAAEKYIEEIKKIAKREQGHQSSVSS